MISFSILCLVAFTQAAPSPFEMPVEAIKQFFESEDNGAMNNPIPFDNYGTPPDHFPAIIPDMQGPEIYDNETYPGLWTDDPRDCHSVNNCLGNPGDPYAPIYGISDFPSFPLRPLGGAEQKCYVEADCFGQYQVPHDLPNDTEVLFLRSSNFTTLGIGDLDVLPPLIKLRIEYSDLRTIQPRVFESQPTLQELELVGNSIATLKERTFLELADLKTLDLTSNEIYETSRGIFEGLDALTELRIISNRLTVLEDDTFRQMPSLEKLNLEYNNISVIYKYAFRGLPNLKRLYLNHNNLRHVPTLSLRVPNALSHLYLTGNPLRKIFRRDFRGVEDLEELWLDECEIESIAKMTFQGSNLQVLVISDNSLTSLPNLGKMRQLRQVVMEYNPWICDCAMVRTIKWLRRHSIGPELQEPACAAPEHLAGRRAIELSTEDLCSPAIRPMPPRIGYPVTPEEDKTNTGGWLPFTNNPAQLYPIAEPTPEVPATNPTPTTTQSKRLEITTETTENTANQTVGSRSTTKESSWQANHTTSRDALAGHTRGRQGVSTKAVHAGSGDQSVLEQTRGVETTAIDLTTKVTTTADMDITEHTKGNGPLRQGEMAYTAIAIVGVAMLVAVIGVGVFRVFISGESSEKRERHTNHRMELTSANGTASKAPIYKKPHTDKNGNSRTKPYNKTKIGEDLSQGGT